METRKSSLRDSDSENSGDEYSILLNDPTKTNYSTFDKPTSATSSSYFGWVTNYIPSWRTIGYTTAAALTTLPYVPYALTEDPETIGFEWWSGLSLTEQIYKATVAVVFTGVVMTARYNYLPKMVQKLEEIFSKCYKSPANAFSCGTIVTASTLSAIPAAVIGFKGAESLNYFISIPASISCYFSVFSLRIVFMDAFFNKIQMWFDKDQQFQQFLLKQLKQLKNENLETLDLLITNKANGKLLDENLIVETLESLSIELEKTNTDNAFNAETIWEQLRYYLRFAFDAGFGLYLGLSLFLFMGEAGVIGIFEGQKILCDIFFENCELIDPSYITKFIWTAFTGFSSIIAALMSAFDLLPFLVSVYQHIKDQPRDLFKLLLVTVCAGLTATIARNAAFSILSNDSLIGPNLKNNPWLFQTILSGCYMVSISFDGKPAYEISGLTNNSTPSAKNMLLHLEKNPLSKKSVSALKHNSFFSKTSSTLLTASSREDQNITRKQRLSFC